MASGSPLTVFKMSLDPLPNPGNVASSAGVQFPGRSSLTTAVLHGWSQRRMSCTRSLTETRFYPRGTPRIIAPVSNNQDRTWFSAVHFHVDSNMRCPIAWVLTETLKQMTANGGSQTFSSRQERLLDCSEPLFLPFFRLSERRLFH